MASNSGQRSGSSDRSKKGSDRSAARRGRGSGRRTPPVLAGSGARAATEKREARDRRLQQRRRRDRARLLIWAIGAVVVFVALVFVYNSDLFPVERVEVTGTDRLTEDAVRALADVPADATLLRFPADEVRGRVEADPWVSTASITRDFPDTMQIRVVEREPAALVDMMDEYLLVDADGYIIEVQALEETTTLVVIRDLDGLDPTPGSRSSSEALHNALAILEGLSSEMRSIVRAISAPTIDETALLTTEGIEVFFGLAEDVAKKDTVARSILEAQADTVVFIDVRVVDRPLTRGLND